MKQGSGPISRFALIPLLVLATGCATSLYRDPSLDEKNVAPTARLVLRNQNVELASFRTFDDAARCAKPLVIADGVAIGPREEADIGVTAGRDFTFEAKRQGPEPCSAIATFKPEAGKQYLAQFGSSDGVCWMNLVRVDSVVPPKVTPEPSLRSRRAAVEGCD